MADNPTRQSEEEGSDPSPSARVDSFGSIAELIRPIQSLPSDYNGQRSSISTALRRSSEPSNVNVRRISDNLPPSKVAWHKRLERGRRQSQETFDRKLSETSWRSQYTPSLTPHSEGEESDEKTLHPASSCTLPGARKALTDFHTVVAKDDLDSEPWEVQRAKFHAKDEEAEILAIHKQLVDWDKEQHSTRARLLGFLREPIKRTERPSHQDLIRLIKYCYPPRCEVKAIVYDVYLDHATVKEIDVGVIQKAWEEKPADVVLRWIHCPFGLGLPHSSVEDLFRYAGPAGKMFENAGYQGFPYLETEALHFRSREQFERMRDVYVLLSKDISLYDALNKSSFAKDQNEDLQRDLQWRANHTASSLDFWSLCNSDVPCQLSEKPMGPTRRLRDTVMGGPLRGLKEVDQEYQRQAIASHPFFEESVLMSSDFRAFHASDGFLLTLSAAKGVDYLDKHFTRHLEMPQDFLFKNARASVVARVMQQFMETGAMGWHRITPEWFTVYLITEIGSTPHFNIDGCTAPNLKNAYEAVIGELKRRRYEPWERQKTIDLVHEYINCMDELNVLLLAFTRKKTIFTGLVEDCQRMEDEWTKEKHTPHNESGESCVERARWALKVATENVAQTQAQITDLQQSLEALFQLRSIEQNERAILAEKLNKAVFVFTGVTIIFLPLSFFTSYFGMNLEGIIGTRKGEKFFWSVCGTISLIIVLATLMYAFLSQHASSIRAWWKNNSKAVPKMGTSPV